ncbi:MAG: hypothetical protein IMF06_15610, partial [Proteobacteria bacterium]|nr:hypothetical protein [Pseudomonadota bacterium]
IIKPSNWANTLLADLGVLPDLRLVQISSDIESYLCAHMRGGKPRINYSLKLLNHLAQASVSINTAITEIEQMKLPVMANIFHLLALCLLVQEAEFDANKEQARIVLELNKKDLMRNPESAVNRAAKALGIAKPYDTQEALQHTLRINAKMDKPASYSPTEEGLQNTWLKREYRAELKAAYLWFEEQKAGTSPAYAHLITRGRHLLKR